MTHMTAFVPQDSVGFLVFSAFAMSMHSTPALEWNDPTSLAAWQRFRTQVRHPCTVVKPEDLARARANLAKHDWARAYLRDLRKRADETCRKITPAWLETMIEVTTPGCVGPCPACRAKGLPWHPNGQWSWSPAHPNQLRCRVCGTVFPNDEFPETIAIRSKWDPRQVIRYVGGEPFRCFGYLARPSISGIIRARKVSYATNCLYTLATAYALTGEARYARSARAVLLRFAETLPHWLVRAGYAYGEYADCDPHVAARRIRDLPTDEIVAPPNRPDRKLHAGYWAASRVGTSGMDGWWVAKVTEAYDLICEARDENGKPVFPTAERETIEREVLLESAYLATCDPAVNNKSVGNRTGAALVGLCIGQPDLTRFGLDGFLRTVNDWFLPDGGTSESAAYALMTMSGIRPFALAFRDYTEPEGYTGPDGRRIEHFDAARDTLYGDAWQALLWTLQGDLRHPPAADSYRTTRIRASFAELLALLYPTPRMFAFLHETVGEAPDKNARRSALLYRNPDPAPTGPPTFDLPDVVFPYLSQGFLRAGPHGRRALLLLNAGWWGNHHHLDSLDLYYWDHGRELLSDLGYLWDHPDHYQTRRTRAHNTVMIDRHDQRGRGRRGRFHLFAVTPVAKIMEASSEAYPEADIYRRTCFFFDFGESGSYVVDFFRVRGGRVRDYVFHGPGNDMSVDGLDLRPAPLDASPVRFAVRLHLDALGEIEVADPEIRELRNDRETGPDLLAKQARETSDHRFWGRYIGDGDGVLTVAQGGADHAPPIFHFRATARGKKNPIVNVGLMFGRSDGYTGREALLGRPGGAYRFRCRIRGNVPRVRVQTVCWPDAPSSPRDRHWTPVRVNGANSFFVPSSTEWKTLTADFTLPQGGWQGIAHLRSAGGATPWRASWDLGDDRRFSAWLPGSPDETVFIGDGWGQRDHRNSDRGATLPYIFRRREGADRLDVFAAVFAGEPQAEPIVRGVKRLPVRAPAAAAAAALAVDTSAGPRIVISRIETDEPCVVEVDAASFRIVTDARAAVIAVTNGVPAAACMVGGSRLEAGPLRLATRPAVLRGPVLSVGRNSGASWFTVPPASLSEPARERVAGGTLVVHTRDGAWRAWPVRRIEAADDGVRLYTKWNHVGFEARPADHWEFNVTTTATAADAPRQ